jgi:prolyl-tRNA synthetase
MKLRNSFFYTLRENSKDEDSVSGNLLVKAGFVKKSSSGIYMYMPMGLKVLKNIEKIVREEMNNAGAQEVVMPSLISEDVYVQSGRRANFGASMFTLNDRFKKPFVLGPTHEELFAIAAQMKIRSYKDLPFNLYQFQTKFRDEPRPRYGLIRVREFVMKDAYSFDRDLDGLAISYDKMFNAYKNSFDRMKIKYQIVKADTGVMGGLLSEEFQAITPIGEDTVVSCTKCGLSSNIEVCPSKTEKVELDESLFLPLEKVYTPNSKTIEEVSSFLNMDPHQFVKTMIYNVDDERLVAVLVRGDYEVNENKLQKLLDCRSVELASYDDITNKTNSVVGFAGPVGLNIDVIVDNKVLNMYNFIVGANESNYHLKNCNLKDFKYTLTGDIVNIREHDECPFCDGTIVFNKGIEIGNTFKLGTKYSKALNLQYLDQNQKLQDVYMGSYGIGIGRCLASIVEQNHDDKGIIFPKDIAPFKVGVITINIKDQLQNEVSERLYNEFNALGIEALLDDRDERAGVKFNDLELIGLPIRITVGKKVNEGIVEVKVRSTQESFDVKLDDLTDFIKELLERIM